MTTLQNSLQKNIQALKKQLPSEDILSYAFQTEDKISCALFYADGMVNKQLLGDLVARPLSRLNLSEKNKNKEGRYELNKQKAIELIEKTALFPELKQLEKVEDVKKEVLDAISLCDL